MRRLAVAVAFALISGCAAQPTGPEKMWYRKDTGRAQFDKDSARCRNVARGIPSQALPYRPRTPGEQIQQAGRDIEDAANYRATFVDCMVAEGYVYR